MNWMKIGAAAFGILITVMAASSDANATGIGADHAIDAQVQIGATSTRYR